VVKGFSDVDITALANKCDFIFNQVYYKYNKLIFVCIYKITKNLQDTEDLLQETFTKLIKSLENFKGNNLKYFLLQIAKNTANEFIRKKIHSRKREIEFIKSSDNQKVININEELLLNKIKPFLTEEAYSIVFMHHVRHMKFKEIAIHFNVSTSSIINKYHRALKKLREKFNYEEILESRC